MAEENKKSALALYLNERSESLQKWCVQDSGLDALKLMRVAELVVRKEPKFQDPKVWPSLYLSLLTAAQLGLDPSGIFGEGYIIPYWDRSAKCNLAQFQPGYRGLMKLITQTPSVKRIRSVVVYSGDEFEYREGIDANITHVINTTGERGEPIGAYSIAYFTDGSWDSIWCPQSDIDKAKQEKSPAWREWPDEMAKKFAIKRHSKQLPMSPVAMNAVEVDNLDGDPMAVQEIIDVKVIDEPAPEPSKLTKKLKERKAKRASPQKKASNEVAKPEPPPEEHARQDMTDDGDEDLLCLFCAENPQVINKETGEVIDQVCEVCKQETLEAERAERAERAEQTG